jgi:hypothetical protein
MMASLYLAKSGINLTGVRRRLDVIISIYNLIVYMFLWWEDMEDDASTIIRALDSSGPMTAKAGLR